MNVLARIWLRLLATNRGGAAMAVVTTCAGWSALDAWPIAGAAACAVGLALLLGVAKFFVVDAQRTAPPGRRLDVGGLSLHLLAEGRADAASPVVWIGGGHGEGLVMAHLHRAAARQTRSIVFDRAGAGWSDPAPTPLTLSREIEHLHGLLDAAGEAGPFVLAGHSFGGLFAANFAQRHPARVVGLVLMDPTPPANVTIAGALSFGELIRKAPWRAFALQLGVTRAGSPEIDDPNSAFYRCLAEWAATINRNSLQPKSVLAEAAAFRAVLDRPYDLVCGAGALGSIPLVMLLANPSAADTAHMREQLRSLLGLDAHQEANLWRAMDDSSADQQRLSSDARIVHAPDGASHMFPYEHPEFVLDAVLSLARATRRAGATATDSPVR